MSRLSAHIKVLMPATKRPLPVLSGPFRGARFYGDARASFRKIFGLYEHELNKWLTEALKRADLVIDVGANDGYFCFGAASAMARSGKTVRVLAFEPDPIYFESLEMALGRSSYSRGEVRLVPKFADAIDGPISQRLDSFISDYPEVRSPLIKIDVEGAELKVLLGAAEWLKRRSALLLIEVHSRQLLHEVPQLLSGAGLSLERIDQQPLPILGREHRSEDNWWLATDFR